MSQVSVDFEFDRAPDPEWVRALRERWPITGKHGFPWLIWEPGDPWDPGNRWVIYECVNPRIIEEAPQGYVILDELRGPHPRSMGHLCWSQPWPYRSTRWQKVGCLCRRKTDSWRGGPMVSLTQWRLFQEHGYVGWPLWTIQGDRGGHRMVFTEMQEQLLRQEGLPHEPPCLGELPYAPFDNRVLEGLTREHRLTQLRMTLDEFERTMGSHSAYEAHKESLERDYRRQYVAHMQKQVVEDEWVDHFQAAASSGEIDANAPRTEIDFERLDDLNDAHYVETGRILAPSQISTNLMVSLNQTRNH